MSNAKTICDALSPLICFEESRQRSIRRELWVLFESPNSRRCSTNPDLYRFINSIPGDLFCTFDTLSPTDKDVVLDFIEQGNVRTTSDSKKPLPQQTALLLVTPHINRSHIGI